jgi:hypothetical protein
MKADVAYVRLMKPAAMLAFVSLFFCACDHGSGGMGSCGPTLPCHGGAVCHDGHCEAPDLGSGHGGNGGVDGSVDGAAGDLGSTSDMAGIVDFASTIDFASNTTDLAHVATCGACNTPPDACHGQQGTCQNGSCVYTFVDGAPCDDHDPCTVADTCMNGGCFGRPKVCNTPPANACISTTSLLTYDSQGTCSGGLCVYASHDTVCSGACMNDKCTNDACGSITCNTPPSVCYATSGSCANGSCTYPFANGTGCNDANPCTTNDMCSGGVCQGTPLVCDTPPASICLDASTLELYAASGSCNVGTCVYTPATVNCAAGCSNGACNPSGWKLMTSNTNQDLMAVWGSSASAVWAGGAAGTIVFYNGATWQVRSLPAGVSTDGLSTIHGTAANNVFAVVGSLIIVHYDGAAWSQLANLTNHGCRYITGIFASGDSNNDVYVTCASVDAGQQADAVLDVVDRNGTITPLTAYDLGAGNCGGGQGGVWEFSSTDVVTAGCTTALWNGTSASGLGATTALAQLWAASPTAVFGTFINSQSLHLWNGSSWSNIGTGLNGFILDVWGLNASRVYMAAQPNTGGPVILEYDGSGVTSTPMPTGTKQLAGIWVAPTGQVFAVGQGGTIVSGP